MAIYKPGTWASRFTPTPPVTMKKDRARNQRESLTRRQEDRTPLNRNRFSNPTPEPVKRPSYNWRNSRFLGGSGIVDRTPNNNGPRQNNGGFENPFGIPVPDNNPNTPLPPMNNGGGGQQLPDLNSFLAGDTTYGQQMSLLKKTLQDFILSNQNQRGNVEEDFVRTMGKLNKERERGLEGMEADYAARNMLPSGLYGDDVSEYNTDFQETVTDLNIDKTRALEDLIETLTMFQNSVQGQEMLAKQEAMRRYAERFSQIPGSQEFVNVAQGGGFSNAGGMGGGNSNGGGGFSGGGNSNGGGGSSNSPSRNNDEPRDTGSDRNSKPYAGIIRPERDSRLMQDALSDGRVTNREERQIRNQVQRSREAGTLTARDRKLLKRINNKTR